MEKFQHQYGADALAEALEVSESGFAAHRGKQNGQRWKQDAELRVMIAQSFEQSRNTYGSPRVRLDLRELGHHTNERRVFKCIPLAYRHHSLTPVLDWLLFVAAGVTLGIWTAADAITLVTGQAQRGLAPQGCDILTCGGPGLMQAANEGAHSVDPEGLRRSIGINIELPFEQELNPFVSQAYGHRTFFSRLHHFMIASDAFVVVPGGIGSLLELSLAWQLLQVRKLYNTPLILAGKIAIRRRARPRREQLQRSESHHHDRRRRHRLPLCFVPRRRLGAAPDGVRPGLNALLTSPTTNPTMAVADYKTYCQILDRARAGRFALPAVNVTSLTTANERVKQAVNDLRGTGKTMFAS